MQNLTVICGNIIHAPGYDPLIGPVWLEDSTRRMYEFQCPLASMSALLKSQRDEVTYVHCHYNEKTGENWYAFSCAEERSLFLRMLECDGIGPVKALNIIARTSWKDIEVMIATGNREGFIKLPGVGPKTGEAMLRVLFAGSPTKKATATTQPAIAPLNVDCVMALTALGFKRPEAEMKTRKAQEAMPDCHDAEKLLPAALKCK